MAQSFTVTGDNANNMDVYSGSYRGLLINISASSAPNPELIQVNSNFTCPGNNVQVTQGNLLALAKATTPQTKVNTLIPTASAQYAYYIDFGTTLNIKQGDQLTVKVQVSAGVSGQVLTCSLLESVGVMDWIPSVQVNVVDEAKTGMPFSPGDCVTKIAVVQTSVVHIVQSMVVSSDKWNVSMATQQFNGLIASQWQATITDYSYCIYQGFPLMNVKADITIQSGTGNAYVVFFAGIMSNRVSANAKALRTKIAETNAVVFGQR